MKVLLRAGLLIDGICDAPVANPLIEIEDALIRSVSSGEPPAVTDAHIVDLGDLTVIPGLIDAHVHLTLSCEENARDAFLAASDEELLAKARDNAKIHLEAGVTSVRDCGGRGNLMIRLAREIDTGKTLAARILPSGAPVCVERGHLWFMGGEVRGIDEIDKTINEQVDGGAHYIKITSTGGGFTPGTVMAEASFTLDEMRAAVRAAHSRGVHIASHAHGAPGIRTSAEARVDTIEHCSWASPSGPVLDRDVLREIVENDCWVVPTMSSTILRARIAPDEAMKRPLPIRVENVTAMLDAGVRMIAGTDCGPSKFARHGSLAGEIAAMHHAGLSTVDAIKSATGESARALRVADRIGSVRAGLRADLVALRSNPVLDIGALGEVQLVFKDGRPVAGPGLSAIARDPRAPAAWKQPNE